jgi:drug/metabolite transporter (DMT)-like permease
MLLHHAPHASPTPSARRLVALAYLLGAGTMLGLSMNLARGAADVGVTPFALLTWACVGATAVLGALAAWRRTLPPVRRATVVYAAVAGLIGVVGPNLIFYAAIPHVTVGVVALAQALPPLLTYVAALALRMERFDRVRAAGVACALGGAAVLAARQVSAPDAPLGWLAAVVAGPVLIAAGNVYRTRRWPPGCAAEGLAPAALGAATVMLVGASALPSLSLAVPVDRVEPALLIVAQAGCLSLMYLLFFALQRAGGPVVVSLLGPVGAVVAVPVALLALAEPAPRGLAPAAALVAVGVVLVAHGGLVAARREAAARAG